MKMRCVGAALSVPVLAAALLLGSSAAVASQATPVAGGNYPVAIHQGTCAAPTAQPAYQLDSTIPVGADHPDASVLGQPNGVPVLTTTATIEATLDDIANGGNVVAVHASLEDFDTIIACGQIGGPNVEGTVTIALQPVGESTVAGIATLTEGGTGLLGLGGDQLQVTVYVIETDAKLPAAPAMVAPIAQANAPTPTPVA